MNKMQIRSEQLIINSILSNPSVIHEIMSSISVDMFVSNEHRIIFRSIVSLYVNGEPINLITIYKDVNKDKSSLKSSALDSLTKVHSMFSSSDRLDIGSAVLQLLGESVRSEHFLLGQEISNKSKSDEYDPKDILDMLQGHILENKFKSILNKKDFSNNDLLEELDKKMIESAANSGISGIKTGYDRIDKITAGMQPTNFIVVAARPAMGKTQFGLGILRNASIRNNKKGLFISCEMDEVQVMKRIIAVDSGVAGYSIKRGVLEQHEQLRFEKSRKRIVNAPFKIRAGSFTIADVLSLVYKMKLSEGLDYVVIDYIQKITSPGAQNRTNEVGDVCRKLKDMANDLKIPIVALAQLSRAVEHRVDKKPVLSDLRESGDIEQDADIVMFLYRPSYYMSLEEKEINPMSDDGYVIIAKHRDGELEDVFLKFDSNVPAWLNRNKNEYDEEYTQSSIVPNIDFDGTPF